MPVSSNAGSADPPRSRLWAEDRRRQLIQVAGEILESEGVDAVRVPRVAEAAGVTRPVVYRHFENRQALIMAVLEAYGEVLQARFRTAMRDAPVTVEGALAAVIDATCDSLESEGTGAWRLMSSGGPDPEIDEVARQMRAQLIRPWLALVGRVTGASRRDSVVIAEMVVEVVQAAIRQWIDDRIARDRAVRFAMRGARGIFQEFTASDAPA